MSTKVERGFNEYARDNGSEGRISRLPGLFADRRMNLRCPDCGGRDLRKVSFAYEQGLSHTTAKSRWGGFLLGDIVVGHTVTEARHESQLSVRLRPPKKWSYRKVILGATLVSSAFLIAYIHIVMASSTRVSSQGVVSYLTLAPVVLLFGLFLVRRHNSSSYPTQ